MTTSMRAGRHHRATRVALALILACSVALVPVAAVGEPYRPTDDEQVLERLPRSSEDPLERERRALLRGASRPTVGAATRDTDDPNAAAVIARQYLARGRAESDPRYFGYAQAALAPWWHDAAAPAEIVLLRANLRQSNHDFAGALADLEALVRVDPANMQAWLSHAIVLQARGDYREAGASCKVLMRAAVVDPALRLRAVTCTASVSSFNGEAEAAYGLLRDASATSRRARMEDRLWATTVLADIATRRGDTVAAETHYRTALAVGGRDVALVAAYADLLLDRGRAPDALALLAGETRADALLLRLALAASAAGSGDASGYIETLRARFGASRARNDRTHLREEARFTLHLLHDPATALRLALENWTVQREPEDARILLEAAAAAGDRAAAKPVVRWLDERGLEDIRLTALRAAATADHT